MAHRADLYAFTLSQLRSGRASEEASKKLNDLVCACRDTGKVGTLTVTLKVKPDKGDTGQYFIEGHIKPTHGFG